MSDAIRPRWPVRLLALAAFAGAFALTRWVSQLGHWPQAMSAMSGRAILGIEGKADLSTLLAGYPPIPYVLTSLAGLLATPFGLNPLVLLSALLLAAFVWLYTSALSRTGYAAGAIIAFALVFLLNPLTLHAVASGPQILLLFFGIWMLGHGMFGLRATSGVNDIILLALSLPLLALTSIQGAIIAAGAIPFLLLAVPRQLIQRAYGSVYLVLLFPLLFSILSVMFVGWILLHDPLAPVSPNDLLPIGWNEPVWRVIAGVAAAGAGALAILPGMIARAPSRRPVAAPAAALFGTMLLSAILFVASSLTGNVLDALAPLVAAVAVATVRWPAEAGRFARSFGLAALGLIGMGLVAYATSAYRTSTVAQVLRQQPSTAASAADVRLGQFLQGKQDVMFDAIAYPEVVSGRGTADGLVTAYTPRFQVDVLRRQVTTGHVVTRAHRPGTTDDTIARIYHDLHERGRPCYRLSYDKDGWRVWTREPGRTRQ